ncbi:AAA family ATPase [Methylocella silvestris]|uniref:non-specific protein-tyrosine kinase n=1 Tax=Methylocella silvestris TaxID=199596 RepID=A0A2J7TD71_METSI|nr:AAA family ATPase [Methylocella silvestris]PNG24734.1 chain-length determining protein [Methylocella silvestris]
MLNAMNTIAPAAKQSARFAFKPRLDMLAIARAVRRQWPAICASVLFMLALSVVYIYTTAPRYTSDFLLLIDPEKSQVLSKRDRTADHPIMDPGFIDSQAEVLKSDSVILSVVRSLKLAHDPEIFPPYSLMSQLTSWFASLGAKPASDWTETRLEEAAVQQIVSNLKIKRVRATNVIQVELTLYNAEKAALIANALAEGYMNAELDANFQTTRRATKWLQDRLKELRAEAAASDKAVQIFKSDNNIVDTSRGLMSEQQLSDVNGQLVAAKATTAEAQARLDRITEVSQGDVVNGSVADALQSPIITRLRAQYLDLSSRAADLSSKYGTKHGVVVNIYHQMNELRKSMLDEIRRIGEGTKSDYEIASARQKSVQDSLDSLVMLSHVSNQAQVELRDLESSAQTSRSVYDNFLSKLQEANQQQTFPVSDARVITPASVPDRPSWPRKLVLIPGAIFFGLMLGGSIAAAREFLGSNFRTADDVVNYTGLTCLGILPDISLKASPRQRLRQLLGSGGGGLDAGQIVRHSVSAPFSRFTETLRNVKVSVDTALPQTQSRVIGIVSSLPREGKTTFVANIAFMTAQMGHKTLLIDADLHNPSLTATVFPKSKSGLLELLTESKVLADVIITDPATGLDFIPAVIKERHTNVTTLLTSSAMINLLADVREKYEYVFVDFPPVVPIVDVKAVAHLIDAFVFLIQWSETSQKVVLDALSHDEQLVDRIVGAVLTRADPTALKRIEAYKGPLYGSYYVNPD